MKPVVSVINGRHRGQVPGGGSGFGAAEVSRRMSAISTNACAGLV